MNWSDKAIRRLCQSWGDGLPMTSIARQIGTTRNAVGGKIMRLRDDHHPAMIEADARRGPKMDRMAQVAEWMAENDGRICDMARDLFITPCQALHAWQRVCRAMGEA